MLMWRYPNINYHNTQKEWGSQNSHELASLLWWSTCSYKKTCWPYDWTKTSHDLNSDEIDIFCHLGWTPLWSNVTFMCFNAHQWPNMLSMTNILVIWIFLHMWNLYWCYLISNWKFVSLLKQTCLSNFSYISWWI
jgi:hypothetical protein